MTPKSKLELVDPDRTAALQIADDLDAAIEFAMGLEFAIAGAGAESEPLRRLAMTLTERLESIRARYEEFRQQVEAGAPPAA
jgi:hypothetical protein